MSDFGLIGKNISYSFSKTHFNAKFEKEQLSYFYETFDIDSLEQFPNILKNNKNLKNV